MLSKVEVKGQTKYMDLDKVCSVESRFSSNANRWEVVFSYSDLKITFTDFMNKEEGIDFIEKVFNLKVKEPVKPVLTVQPETKKEKGKILKMR